MSNLEDGYYQEVENLRREVETLRRDVARAEDLRKCCSQRGARMQIMRSYFRGVDWDHAVLDYPDMNDWFDEDGVPK